MNYASGETPAKGDHVRRKNPSNVINGRSVGQVRFFEEDGRVWVLWRGTFSDTGERMNKWRGRVGTTMRPDQLILVQRVQEQT